MQSAPIDLLSWIAIGLCDYMVERTALLLIARIPLDLGRVACLAFVWVTLLLLPESTLAQDDIWTTQSAAGVKALDAGKYKEAEKHFLAALEIAEKFDATDFRLARSLNNLSALYLAQGRYPEAEPLCKRAVEMIEIALGPEDPEVANNLNTLAALYLRQGRYTDAGLSFKRALAISEKALGPEHRDVGLVLNNLGAAYNYAGRNVEAEPLLVRALRIREKTL